MQNGLRLLGTSVIATGMHPGPDGPSITLCAAALQLLDTFSKSSQPVRSPPVFQVGGEAGPEQPAIPRVELPFERSRQIPATLDQSCWHEDPVVLGFQPLRLSCIHYTCPFGALLPRPLLPWMGVGLCKLLSTYRMPVSGSGSPELQGHAPGY